MPGIVDADWAVDEEVVDKDAQCLDATSHGNVARLTNNR